MTNSQPTEHATASTSIEQETSSTKSNGLPPVTINDNNKPIAHHDHSEGFIHSESDDFDDDLLDEDEDEDVAEDAECDVCGHYLSNGECGYCQEHPPLNGQECTHCDNPAFGYCNGDPVCENCHESAYG